MKVIFLLITNIFLFGLPLKSEEVITVAPDPVLTTYEEKARKADIIFIIGTFKNGEVFKIGIKEILHGKSSFKANETIVNNLIPKIGKTVNAAVPLEVYFIRLSSGPEIRHRGSSIVIHPEEVRKIGPQKFKFEQYPIAKIKEAITAAVARPAKERQRKD